jgi:hypothetical protein
MGKKIKEIWSNDTTKFALVLAILMAIAFYRSYDRFELKVQKMQSQRASQGSQGLRGKL